MQSIKNQLTFFELLRVGLWEVANDNLNHNPDSFKAVDWQKVYLMAQDQSVQGLVLQGLEWFMEHGIINKAHVPQELMLQWIGEVQMIEQQNKAMNEFVARLIELLRKNDVYAILVKGQGIAQCYEKPLWRACGDVDLLLSEGNYKKAKKELVPLASEVETEYTHFKHVGMTIDGWVVELHGTLHSRLSARVDDMIDNVQGDVLCSGSVRLWQNGKTQVFLPSANNDIIFVFTHLLHHFFFEGIGLRQICDWCRLLWTYKDSLNRRLLESRIKEAGLMSEWCAFAAYAVEYLGMPMEAMPLYVAEARWPRKASRINEFVLEVGNLGFKQRRDYRGMSYMTRKIKSSFGRLSDMLRHFAIFPKDSIEFFGGVLRSGLHAVVRGE